jgi:hypothetical protein
MADANLTVTIGSQEVRVGDPANSRLSIEIKNTGNADVTFTFYLTIPSAFVAKAAVTSIDFRGLEATQDPENQPQDKTTWRIGARKGTLIKSSSAMTLTLSRITAASAEPQTVGIEWRTGGTVVGSKSLPVTVLAVNDAPKIVSFEAESHTLIWSPGKKLEIKLSWETDKDSVVELWRLGTKLLPAPGEASAPRAARDWPDVGYASSGIQPYQLTATAKGKTVSRWEFVRVQDPGWNRIECSQGAPTLLLDDGGQTLYGIFVRDGEAAVFRLEPDQGSLGRADLFWGKVERGMERSPGAFFKNKIWLVGGSQIDPEVCSNMVWSFDPHAKASGPRTSAPWTPRMGHACTTFGDELWILGGVDENGNTLSDVWSFDGATWQERAPLETPLCLLAATDFDKRLWVYGGLDAPFGTPQKALRYLDAGAQDWQEMSFSEGVGKPATPDPGFGDPFASALCVNQTPNGRLLCALGTFQKGDFASAAFTLSGYGDDNVADMSRLTAKYPIGDKEWPTKTDAGARQQPFRLSAVSFGFYIFAFSLVYGADNRSLTYLVQS